MSLIAYFPISAIAVDNSQFPILAGGNPGEITFVSHGKTYGAVFETRLETACSWGHMNTLHIYETASSGSFTNELFKKEECGVGNDSQSGAYLLGGKDPQIVFVVNRGNAGFEVFIFDITDDGRILQIQPALLGRTFEIKDFSGDGKQEVMASVNFGYRIIPRFFSLQDKKLNEVSQNFPGEYAELIKGINKEISDKSGYSDEKNQSIVAEDQFEMVKLYLILKDKQSAARYLEDLKNTTHYSSASSKTDSFISKGKKTPNNYFNFIMLHKAIPKEEKLIESL